MHPEKYITPETLEERTQSWLDDIAPYMRAPWDKPVPRQTAILIIDAQRYFFDDEFHAALPAAPAIVPNIMRLVEQGAQLGANIFLTRHAERDDEIIPSMLAFWGQGLADGTPEAELIPELAQWLVSLPNPMKLPVIRKWTYDAFFETELKHILRAREIRWLAIAGVMSDLCCETSARSAFIHGFFPIVVADAMATSSEELHLSALRTLAHGFAEISTTERFLNTLA